MIYEYCPQKKMYVDILKNNSNYNIYERTRGRCPESADNVFCPYLMICDKDDIQLCLLMICENDEFELLSGAGFVPLRERVISAEYENFDILEFVNQFVNNLEIGNEYFYVYNQKMC